MDDCIRYKDKLHEWVDGELVDGDADEVDLHLTLCSECADTARAIEHMKLLVQAKARPARIPDGLQEKVRQAITVESSRQSYRRRWTGRKLIPFATAAAVLLVILSSLNPFSTINHQELQASVGEFVFDSHLRSIHGDDGPTWFFGGAESAAARISSELSVPSVILPNPEESLRGVSFIKMGDLRIAKVFYQFGADECLSIFVIPRAPEVQDGCYCIKEGRNFAVFCLPGESVCYLFATNKDAKQCQDWFNSCICEECNCEECTCEEEIPVESPLG
ncbi:MAG: zf-HC2 domain-containing protein [Planctomycetota bacterium]|nr:zf-HC2 domain-containing protein [Planctomycetota bacterium]